MDISSTILLVEDDRFIALALQIRLQAKGFEVYTVSGCEAALGSAAAHRPDIALLDYNLPDGNGLNLMQRLDNMFQQKRIASIMMTASKVPGLREQALEQGAIGFFEKPFDSAVLIKAIEIIRNSECAGIAQQNPHDTGSSCSAA